jgi:hypothetical protein
MSYVAKWALRLPGQEMDLPDFLANSVRRLTKITTKKSGKSMVSGLDKFMRMVTGSKQRQTGSAAKRVDEIINMAGRVRYGDLQRMVDSLSSRTLFAQAMRRPALVGSALFHGVLHTMDKEGMKTMQFIHGIDDDSETAEPAQEIKGGIYPLIKNRRRRQVRNKNSATFTIGRRDDNDFVMPDYSISKHHADICITDKGYSLIDQHSTNGTFINGIVAQPGKVKPFTYGDRIKFGRYEFLFLSPSKIYLHFSGKD